MFGASSFGRLEFAQGYPVNAPAGLTGTAAGSSTATLAVLQTFVVTASAPGDSTATLAVTKIQFITASAPGDSASTLAMLQNFLIAGAAPGDSSVSIVFFTPISATGTLSGEAFVTLDIADFSGNWGIRVSQSNFDVLTDPDNGMILTSKYQPIRIAFVYTGTLSFDVNQSLANFLVNTGVTTSAQTHPLVFMDVGNGQMIRANVADFGGSNSDGFNCFPTTSYTFDSGTGLFTSFIGVNVQRETYSSTWPNATSITFRLYLVI